MAYLVPLNVVFGTHILGGSMAGKRELIEPHEGDERYMRRDESGQFTESDDMNRSLSRDNDREAQHTSEPGQGDRGDRGDRSQSDQGSSGDTSRKGSSSSSSSSRKSGSPRGAAGRRNKGGTGGTGSGGGR
ncbi:MAG TPA: hypothetical protein VES88_11860 [Gemmatimonadaceae bacterium]|nr:hypothetical protein [Gemmatimonadaceae bacterium]